MIKKSRISLKSQKKPINFARSLSARVSPLASLQKFEYGLYEFEGLSKQRISEFKLMIPDTKLNSLKYISAKEPQHKESFKFESLKLKPNTSKKEKKTVSHSKNKEDDLKYIKDLKKKLAEILDENKSIKKKIKNKVILKKKKLWPVVENFKTKLNDKLASL